MNDDTDGEVPRILKSVAYSCLWIYNRRNTSDDGFYDFLLNASPAHSGKWSPHFNINPNEVRSALTQRKNSSQSPVSDHQMSQKEMVEQLPNFSQGKGPLLKGWIIRKKKVSRSHDAIRKAGGSCRFTTGDADSKLTLMLWIGSCHESPRAIGYTHK